MKGTIRLFDINIHAVDLTDAASIIVSWIKNWDGKFRYAVTPNVNHVVKLQKSSKLRSAYDNAAMVLADGKPIVWASKIVGHPLPERVAGSDLVPSIFSECAILGEASVFLLGAMPGVGECAAENIRKQWPHIKVCGTYSPPFGFEKNPLENQNILKLINKCSPDLVVIGLGAPKQEIWVYDHMKGIDAKVAICAGATIDFLAGSKRRAPNWMRLVGIEWVHRMITDTRLVRRYSKDLVIFPWIFLRTWINTRKANNQRNVPSRRN